MSITSWEQAARDLLSNPILQGLPDEQVEAIIDVLTLTIHADQNVSPVEVAGFNHLFFDLPWLEDRDGLVREHIPVAVKKAMAAGEGGTERALADEVASTLEDGGALLKEKVFLMASILASVDMRLKEGENKVLRVVGEAFGLDDHKRAELVSQARP